MTLEQYRAALGLGFPEMAQEAERVTKEHVTPALLRRAERGHPIALVKAEALCLYLSHEFDRAIRPEDIAGLKTC